MRRRALVSQTRVAGDRPRQRLAAGRPLHPLAARAGLVGDVRLRRDRRRRAPRAPAAPARASRPSPAIDEAAELIVDGATSTSPCSRSGSRPRGCFRSCASASPRDPGRRRLRRPALPARGAAGAGAGRALDERFGEQAGRRAQHLRRRRRGAGRLGEGGRAAGRLPRPRPRSTTLGARRAGSTRSEVPASTSAGACSSSATSGTCRTARRSSTCAATSCRGSTRSCSPSIRCRSSAAGSTRRSARTARGMPGVKMVGWVPSVAPYLERARVCAVPLLHGAGVKGKIVESLMTGTPVVTTSIGAEGMDLRRRRARRDRRQRRATSPPGWRGCSPTASEWQRLADAGYELAARRARPRSGPRPVPRDRRRGAVAADRASAAAGDGIRGPAAASSPTARRSPRSRRDARARSPTRRRRRSWSSRAATTASLAVDGRTGVRTSRRRPTGAGPATTPPTARRRSATSRSCASAAPATWRCPSTSFWWLHHYAELTAHLEDRYRRIHSGEHVVVFDLGEASAGGRAGDGAGAGRVLVLGSHGAPARDRRRASSRSSTEAAASTSPSDGVRGGEGDRAARTPMARRPTGSLEVGDARGAADGFLDDFLGRGRSSWRRSASSASSRPTTAGPGAGPPVTERLRGVVAREVAAPTPLPVLAVRRGAAPTARPPWSTSPRSTLEADRRAGGRRSPTATCATSSCSTRLDGRSRARASGAASGAGRAADQRPDRHLRRGPSCSPACLEGFCEQTLPVSDFEVVVVDDGSPGAETGRGAGELRRAPSAALARGSSTPAAAPPRTWRVMLARGDIVLFFDDDDVPAPDLLGEHLRAHDEQPGEATAVLGHTDWAPGLEVTPLMHYLTDVDKLLFAYGNLDRGQALDWRCFWEGRISSKRGAAPAPRPARPAPRLLDRRRDGAGGWRHHGLEVVYRPDARSFMARPIDFEGFCRR